MPTLISLLKRLLQRSVPVQPPTPTPPTSPDSTVDYPTGSSEGKDFLAWLNVLRAGLQLRKVEWSNDLESDAMKNGIHCQGVAQHLCKGRSRRQNVASGTLTQAKFTWLDSTPHRDNLFAPDITHIGLAHVNGVWTFNAA